MKIKICLLLLSIIALNACKSPENQIKQLTNDLIVNVKQRNFDDIDTFTSNSIDSLLSKYALLCKYVVKPEVLLEYDPIVVDQININENKANACVNNLHTVQYQKTDNGWKIKRFDDLTARLTALVFLYAMEIHYFQLACQVSSAEYHKKILLMQQYERLSKGEETLKAPDITYEIHKVKFRNNDRAVVFYEKADTKHSLVLLKQNGQWVVNKLSG
ncbi:MAG: hypothetical protein K9H84_07505 [Bacteroidales bacterium]|nr:hypothetical protein [Bacteroidales bacterium]